MALNPIEQIAAELPEYVRMTLAGVTAELRHAYSHLASGSVVDQRGLAEGLLSPQIKRLEALSAGASDPAPAPLHTAAGTPEPWVRFCTLRSSIDENDIKAIDLECRMSDGQKSAFVQVDEAFPKLAERIAAFLNGQTLQQVPVPMDVVEQELRRAVGKYADDYIAMALSKTGARFAREAILAEFEQPLVDVLKGFQDSVERMIHRYAAPSEMDRFHSLLNSQGAVAAAVAKALKIHGRHSLTVKVSLFLETLLKD